MSSKDSAKDSARDSSKGAQLSQDNDIVDLILTDHVTVKEAFQKLKAGKGKDDSKHTDSLEKIYQAMVWSIAEHAVAEELVFYPLLEKGLGKEGQKITAESRDDHEKTKQALAELDGVSYKDGQEKVHVMVEELIEHMTKEEHEDLIVTREKFDKDQLKEAARNFKKAKMFAPKENSTAHGKLPFETPYSLVNAATDKLVEYFEGKLPIDGDESEEGGKRYNLRGHQDEKEGESRGDIQKGSHGGEKDGPKQGKNVSSPAKNGGHEGKSSHKNGSPDKKEAGDDTVSPPAKRGHGKEESNDGTTAHGRKKGVAADRGEEESAANE